MRLTSFLLAMAASVLVIVPGGAAPPPQAKRFALDSVQGLRPNHLSVVPATLDGKKGVKVTAASNDPTAGADMATIEGVDFANGTIEAEIAGAPAPDAPEGSRGFVGIAFRAQADLKTYDAFYLRPTNGRADDQERRNHSAQYISPPDWPWARLRKETPSKYEAYVDLQPNVWTRIKIEVRGDHARLFVHDQTQPTLVINDVKTGASARGQVGLWIDRGTIAHFRNLLITPGE
jgi:hypothetical protein